MLLDPVSLRAVPLAHRVPALPGPRVAPSVGCSVIGQACDDTTSSARACR
jgi:hypothetical protein